VLSARCSAHMNNSDRLDRFFLYIYRVLTALVKEMGRELEGTGQTPTLELRDWL